MPIFEVTVEKTYNNTFWTNVYHVDADSLLEAQGLGGQIAQIERAIHLDLVQFTAVRVSNTTPGNDEFTTTPINQAGLIGGAGEVLPLFNTVRVDFAVFGKRNLRKYLRLPFQEAQQSNGVMNATILNNVDTLYVTPLENLNALVSPSGDVMGSGTVYNRVQMRQLKRGSKRKIT